MLSHSAPPVNLRQPPANSPSASLKFLATRRNRLMFRVEMNLLASFMNLAGPDLIFILLIVLVLFGAKKLPELARGMGQAIKEFQKAKDDFSSELHSAGKVDVAQTPPTAQGTVPQIGNTPASNAQPNPSQTTPPGDKVNPA